MDFWLSDDQVAFQQGIRSFLDARFDLETTASREETDTVIDLDAWRELGDMGVFSLLRDGMDLRTASVVFEELGRSLVPGPLVTTFLAASPDLDLDGAAQGTRLVGSFDPGPDLAVIEHVAQVTDLLWFADGEIRLVDPLALDGHPVARPLDPLTPTFTSTATAPDHTVIADGPTAQGLYHQAVMLTSALAVGASAAATDLATAYAKEREQFGRPIGSFQAVKHLLAEMFTKTDVARAAVHAAACALDGASDDDPKRAASVAKILSGDAALFSGKTGIQVHGGMGFTWEVHAQRYWKRAVVLDASFGTGDHHADAVAAALVGGT